jgi:benzoate transport
MTPNQGADPRQAMAHNPMRWQQVLAIALCVALNALDGFDVLSISFASPGIAKEWAIDRAALGFVLSFELVGMAVGSILLGQVADRLGRRATVLACLVLMALGMAATSLVDTLGALAVTRVATGLGIGGMLAVTNALVAEYANDRWRSAAVTIMAAGYPMGAIAGGALASALLATHGWRAVFVLGFAMTVVLLPLVALFLPEPVSAVLLRRDAGTLDRLNASLRRLGQAAVTALPALAPREGAKTTLADLFSPRLRALTVMLTIAYFMHILTFYFILKWTPKIVADMGYSPSAAGGVLVWANVGGLIGGLAFAGLSLRLPLRALIVSFMLASLVTVSWFGQPHQGLGALAWAGAIGGFCTNAGVVGIYALVAASFPTAVRAGGTGFVIGVGRGGAALGPVIGGMLFKAGFTLPVVAAIMACGALVAAVALLAGPRGSGPAPA